MAFDFKGGRGSAPRPNNTSSGSGSDYPSSFNNIPRPGGNNLSPIPKPADTSAARNTGFQNRPEVKSGGGVTPPSVTPNIGNGRRTGPKRPSTKRRSSGTGNTQIPFRVLFIIFGIIVVIICLWVFRDIISAFLTQVLTWVITVLVIIFLIKWFIFPKRRR